MGPEELARELKSETDTGICPESIGRKGIWEATFVTHAGNQQKCAKKNAGRGARIRSEEEVKLFA
jgi:hypothetical protein